MCERTMTERMRNNNYTDLRRSSCIEHVLETQTVKKMIEMCMEQVDKWMNQITKCYDDSDGTHVETKYGVIYIITKEFIQDDFFFNTLVTAVKELKARGKCK